jgi:hypothetical protein
MSPPSASCILYPINTHTLDGQHEEPQCSYQHQKQQWGE